VKIICLDFDGVIHSYISGWQGARNIPDPPVEGALEWIHKALNSGYRVAIHSSRGRYLFGRRAMRRWLRKHAGGLWYEAPGFVGLEAVEFPRGKPPALVTLDDRAITFHGTFPDLALIADFKPWNHRRVAKGVRLT